MVQNTLVIPWCPHSYFFSFPIRSCVSAQNLLHFACVIFLWKLILYWLPSVWIILCSRYLDIYFKTAYLKKEATLQFRLHLKHTHGGGGCVSRILSPLLSSSCVVTVVLECEWLISNNGICSRGSGESLCHLYFWSHCSTPHQQTGCRVPKKKKKDNWVLALRTEICTLCPHTYWQTHGGTMRWVTLVMKRMQLTDGKRWSILIVPSRFIVCC